MWSIAFDDNAIDKHGDSPLKLWTMAGRDFKVLFTSD